MNRRLRLCQKTLSSIQGVQEAGEAGAGGSRAARQQQQEEVAGLRLGRSSRLAHSWRARQSSQHCGCGPPQSRWRGLTGCAGSQAAHQQPWSAAEACHGSEAEGRQRSTSRTAWQGRPGSGAWHQAPVQAQRLGGCCCAGSSCRDACLTCRQHTRAQPASAGGDSPACLAGQ